MIVKKFRCDHCGAETDDAGQVIGVSLEQDMFNLYKSFPAHFKDVEKYPVHVLQECFRTHAEIPAENESPRRRDEKKFRIAYETYSYLLRRAAVLNFQARKLAN